MAFFIASSPHSHNRKSTSDIMMMVLLCTLPGIAALCYFFGWGVLFQVAIASVTAILAEAAIVALRKRPIKRYLQDNSALLTGLLIGISIPPFAPWWIAVIGSLFAIVIAKHLYGGLGQNPFNPAMVAYVVLLISFPVQMTTWLPPVSLIAQPLGIMDSASSIFTGLSTDGFSVNQLRVAADGMTMATPLDTVKTALLAGNTVSEAVQLPVFDTFAGIGWGWVNLAFLVGGLALIKQRIIQWQIPTAMLGSLLVLSTIGYAVSPDAVISPVLHLFSGATMLGAFFIATDPVSASTTTKGRLVFGAMIGTLVYLIRTFGGFPDGVAFAVLIANMCVPLIDYYTKPTAYGYKKESK
ncbi:electron transport complex subunit RsxD [Enterovibrio sp. ZSDZ42]|uniref:Ion-translocating oxidoreductase complex subunit D n=1 Tax=Enterovibrio gelatinilyticus TaxID=2899819 RepID=A0ABT5R3H2_9GAMM|nr:electron transport complex subunit RsxD [Enterovibrio sp. ZSDZ42]MDD1794321.1 electron transport complex subunit RsxD [Enterovibrio sp. ZSDZ42]